MSKHGSAGYSKHYLEETTAVSTILIRRGGVHGPHRFFHHPDRTFHGLSRVFCQILLQVSLKKVQPAEYPSPFLAKTPSGNLFWLGRVPWQSRGSCTRFKCSTCHSPHKFGTAYFLFNCQEGPNLPPSGVFQDVGVLGLLSGSLNTCQYKPYVLNRMQGDSCIGP